MFHGLPVNGTGQEDRFDGAADLCIHHQKETEPRAFRRASNLHVGLACPACGLAAFAQPIFFWKEKQTPCIYEASENACAFPSIAPNLLSERERQRERETERERERAESESCAFEQPLKTHFAG